MLVVEDRLEVGLGDRLVRSEENRLPVQHSLEAVEPVGDHDIGIEVIDPLGAELLGDVLECRSLDGGAKLDQAVPEDPGRQFIDRQLLDVDDRIESGRDDGGHAGISSESTT